MNITAEKFDPHSIDYDNITTVTVDHSQLQQLVNFTVIQTKIDFENIFTINLKIQDLFYPLLYVDRTVLTNCDIKSWL